MISIILKSDPDLVKNTILLKYLEKGTKNPYQLIVVDEVDNQNKELFKKYDATIIPCYEGATPYDCYKAAIGKVEYPLIAFFNNSFVVSPDWDERVAFLLEENPGKTLSCKTSTILHKRILSWHGFKWRWVPPLVYKVLGNSYTSERLVQQLLYGNWNRYNDHQWIFNHLQTTNGYLYSNLICERSILKKLPHQSEQTSPIITILKYLTSYYQSIGLKDPFLIARGIYFHDLNYYSNKKIIPGVNGSQHQKSVTTENLLEKQSITNPG